MDSLHKKLYIHSSYMCACVGKSSTPGIMPCHRNQPEMKTWDYGNCLSRTTVTGPLDWGKYYGNWSKSTMVTGPKVLW